MSVDILRVESNERVDLPDFEFMSESISAHERQLVDNFLCDPARTRKWILSGFAMSNPAGKQLQVARGKAILSMRVGGVIQYGILATKGDPTLTVDLNAYAPGVYSVYVRFEHIASELQSRTFWNPAGAGSEYAQTVNTRWTAAWSLRVEATSPGDDWLKIGTVDQTTMSFADKRNFFFEGAVEDSYESGWSTEGGGSANDRGADRAAYGVTDLQMFTAAMRQCLEDIKGRGLRKWYSKGIGGMNIGFDTDPTEDKLCVGNATFCMYLTGTEAQLNFTANESIVYDYAEPEGGPTLDFKIDGGIEYRMSALTFYPETSAQNDLGGAIRKWKDLHLSGTCYGGVDASVTGTVTAGFLRAEAEISPRITIKDTIGPGVDRKVWCISQQTDGDLTIGPANDAENTFGLAMTFQRDSGGTNTHRISFQCPLVPETDGGQTLGESGGNAWGALYLHSATSPNVIGDVNMSGPLTIVSAAPIFNLYDTNATANEKYWRFRTASDKLYLEGLDDSYLNPFTIFTIERTGVTAESGHMVYYGRIQISGSNNDLVIEGEAGSGISGANVFTGTYDNTGGTMPGTYTGSIKVWVNGVAKYILFHDSAAP